MATCAACKDELGESRHGIVVVKDELDDDPENDRYAESTISIAVFFPVPDKVTDALLCDGCYESEAYLK